MTMMFSDHTTAHALKASNMPGINSGTIDYVGNIPASFLTMPRLFSAKLRGVSLMWKSFGKHFLNTFGIF